MKSKWKEAGRAIMIENRLVQLLIAKKWSIVLIVMGVLLGRAMILEQLTPFALAYFAVIYYLRRDLILWIGVSLFIGSLLSVHQQVGTFMASVAIFLLIQKGLQRYEHTEISYAPFLVFITTFLVKLFHHIVMHDLTWYALMMIAIEAMLAFILTLIFVQAIPVLTLTRKNVHLKNEEIICFMILLASVMTGTIGWQIGGVSLEHWMSRTFILWFAYVGGAAVGASVGVVTGLILSLANVEAIYQISLLAFAGLLAGLLKEGKKIGVSLGMLLGSTILSLYIGDQKSIVQSTWESLVAVVIFMITPKGLIRTIAKYVPGTQENIQSHQDYIKRVRGMIADRVQQFAEVFQQLSRTFHHPNEYSRQRHEDELNRLLGTITERTCSTCWKRSKCWDEHAEHSTQIMLDMLTTIEKQPKIGKQDMAKEWKQACIKTEYVLKVMTAEYEKYKTALYWKKRLRESKQLVSDQLAGVSQVMEDLACEIKREQQELFLQEEQIRNALDELGLSIHSIDIINLDVGKVEIEMIHQYNKGYDECKKIIAPLLSDILGENIAVVKEELLDPGEGFCHVLFASDKAYVVSTGIAGVAKGGEWLSGDSFSTMELGNGKYAVAISDGMGNGERAKMESETALTILHQLLQSGMDEKLAIKSVNSILLLRSSDEMFATIDVALIDLYTAQTTFVKIGSTPSFIKRGSDVMTVSANNLPVGILQDIDVDLIRIQLKPGDTLIMMTDGIYDAPGYAVNKELWMKRVILEIQEDDPQRIADRLLETIIRHYDGEIMDDMTVIVARLDQHIPEWATFRWPNASRIERPKTVS